MACANTPATAMMPSMRTKYASLLVLDLAQQVGAKTAEAKQHQHDISDNLGKEQHQTRQ
jgi:hypothetical protein